jgi:hypothetical protein
MCRLKKSVYRDHVFEAIAEFLCEKGASRRRPLRGHAQNELKVYGILIRNKIKQFDLKVMYIQNSL